jgi:hypothetical protein
MLEYFKYLLSGLTDPLIIIYNRGINKRRNSIMSKPLEGYKVVDTKDEEGNDALSFISDFAEDGELSCTVHILKKSVGTYAIVLEFGADADAHKKLSEMLTDEDLANIADVDDSSKLLRGNCILVPFTLNIFDAEDIVNEMVTIFNK